MTKNEKVLKRALEKYSSSPTEYKSNSENMTCFCIGPEKCGNMKCGLVRKAKGELK